MSKAAKKPDWFKFYVEKWRGSKAVRAMSPAGRGAYMDLLGEAWHQDPPGSVPDDDDALAELAGVSPAMWKRLRKEVLRAFEKREDGRLYQKFMADVIVPTGYGKVESARAAAQKRWDAEAEKAKAKAPIPDASALQPHVHTQCHQEERRGESEKRTVTAEAAVAADVPPIGLIAQAKAVVAVEPPDDFRLDSRIEALTSAGVGFGQANGWLRRFNPTVEEVENYIARSAIPGTVKKSRGAFLFTAISEKWPIEEIPKTEADAQAEWDAQIQRQCEEDRAKREAKKGAKA